MFPATVGPNIFILNLGLKCFIGEEDDALPATVGPVPDFVVESAGHFGKWTPAGKWDKSVKKEKRKEERKILRRGEDPSIPRNRLPYGDKVTRSFFFSSFFFF